jgi:prevent-host-death family protein
MTMEETYKLADAKARFSEVVRKAMMGETIIVTKENRPVVKIVAIKPAKRKPGTGKGIWMSPDFDEPLEDFKEYMY